MGTLTDCTSVFKEKDDMFLVTAANGDIQTIAVPEVIAETTLSAFFLNNYVINDGTQYDYNTTIEFDVDTLEEYTMPTLPRQHSGKRRKLWAASSPAVSGPERSGFPYGSKYGSENDHKN